MFLAMLAQNECFGLDCVNNELALQLMLVLDPKEYSKNQLKKKPAWGGYAIGRACQHNIEYSIRMERINGVWLWTVARRQMTTKYSQVDGLC